MRFKLFDFNSKKREKRTGFPPTIFACKNGGGFTLVELMVSVAVIAALSLLLIYYFSQIEIRFALSRTAREFADDMRLAQRMALSFSDYQGLSGATLPAAGFGIQVDLRDNKKYVLYADKMPGNQVYDEEDYVLKSVDLSQKAPGIIIQSINNIADAEASVNFQGRKPYVNIYQFSEEVNGAEIVFAIESLPDITRKAAVNKVGLIEVK